MNPRQLVFAVRMFKARQASSTASHCAITIGQLNVRRCVSITALERMAVGEVILTGYQLHRCKVVWMQLKGKGWVK